jgi:CRP-like cAMP-binding protein
LPSTLAGVNEHTPPPAPPAQVRGNGLLDALPRAARERVAAACEAVELVGGEVLMAPGMLAAYAFFPLDAIVSLRMATPRRQEGFEVALVGPEGMVGLPLLLGARTSALRATVVKPGAAWRMTAARMRSELRAGGAFRRRMNRYVLVSLTQMAQGVLCTRDHVVDERLARWLLMTQDRAPLQELHATHEFLAATLGVRRAGITRAAASLQVRHLIAYHRGVLAIVDRPGLEAAACACYAADRASYAETLGAPAA